MASSGASPTVVARPRPGPQALPVQELVHLGELITKCESFVETACSGVDASHDYQHIKRVRRNALVLAAKEGLSRRATLVVELAALLHDVGDWKYPSAASQPSVQAFLESKGADRELVNEVLQIIAAVGFKDELGQVDQVLSQEAAVVQDADRLDAIGAIGIARCFTFGGAFNRILHDPSIKARVGLSKAEYMSGASKNTTINHFHEKLLLLKDKLKTRSGREMGQQRHIFMQQYLAQFYEEWEGRM